MLKVADDENKGIGIRGFQNLMGSTYLGAYTKNSINFARDMMSDITLQALPGFTEALDGILKQVGREFTADTKVVNEVTNELYSMINADFFVNTDSMSLIDISELMFGEDSIPLQIDRIKAGKFLKKHKENPIIKSLVYNQQQDMPDSLIFYNPDSKDSKNSLTRGWRDLFEDEASEDFAWDLLYYSYLSSGFRSTSNSFFDYIPHEYIVKLGFGDHYRNYKEKLQDPREMDKFTDELYKNNWHNPALVPTVGGKDIEGKFVYSDKVGGEEVFMTIGVKNPSYRVGQNKSDQLLYRPYVTTKVGDELNLFKYVGYDRESLTGIYMATDKKSYKKRGVNIRETLMEGTSFKSNKMNKSNVKWEYEQELNEGNATKMFSSQTKRGGLVFPNMSNVVTVTDNRVYVIPKDSNTTIEALEERKLKCK
jgi:hypothetical protein